MMLIFIYFCPLDSGHNIFYADGLFGAACPAGVLVTILDGPGTSNNLLCSGEET